MAKQGGGSRRGQQPARIDRARERRGATLTEAQQAELDALLGAQAALAATLREVAPEGRDALLHALAPVEQAAEPVAIAFAERLGAARGPAAQDAADLAQALGELAPRREVAREARRARIRLRSVGANGALPIAVEEPFPVTLGVELPADTIASAPAAPAPTGVTNITPLFPLAATNQRDLVLAEAHVTRTREQGEVTLVLAWQERGEPTVSGELFELSFWNEGLRNFTELEPIPRARFRREVIEGLRKQADIEFVAINWAQARRLVQQALDVNAWRGSEPAESFRQQRARLDALLLDEPDDEELAAQLEQEQRRVALAGDRPYIRADLDPDETIANWIGAWSFGDFGLTYDLLADDNPLRRAQSREEYIALRRQWFDEAQPDGLRLTVVREQERRASALWVPGAAAASGGVTGNRRDFEGFWSLTLKEAPLGGQLDELPMGTLVSKETGRHWYWTGYTVSRDPTAGLWLINRLRDEGAASQALTIEETQKRLDEARARAERVTQNEPPQPGTDEARDALRTITGELTAALHYTDALLVRLPLDESVYRAAIADARSLANHERAAALLERMQGRFSDDLQLRFEWGAEQYLVAEQYGQLSDDSASDAWLERATATMNSVVEADPSAEHLQGLGELLTQQRHFNQAETRIREAIAKEPERASLYVDLANALMGRANEENADDPITLSDDEQRDLTQQALAALRDAAKIDNALPGLFTRMGAVYQALSREDDALVAYEEATRHEPNDAEAQYTLGSLYLTRRSPQQAIPHLEQALQANPLFIPARVNLAAAHAAQGRFRDALAQLDLVDRIQPGIPQVAEMRRVIAEQQQG